MPFHPLTVFLSSFGLQEYEVSASGVDGCLCHVSPIWMGLQKDLKVSCCSSPAIVLQKEKTS